MPLLRRRPQSAADAFHDRLGEGDLGKQNQHLGSRVGGHQSGGRFQEHLGLARTGDSVQQQGSEAVGEGGDDRSRGRRLALVQLGQRRNRSAGTIDADLGGNLANRQGAGGHERFHDTNGYLGCSRQLGRGHR